MGASLTLEMYGFSKACSGRIQDVAGLAKTQLPAELAEKLIRHFNAAHIAGYVGLNSVGQGSPYREFNFFEQMSKDAGKGGRRSSASANNRRGSRRNSAARDNSQSAA